MAMSYTSLTGGKSAAGSIMNWTSYTKLDTSTVVDEAQFLLFTILRVREMRSLWTFGMAVGQCNAALPPRFLDPIGKVFDITNVTEYGHVIESDVLRQRSYQALSGSFATDPFTATSGSALVNVLKTAHTFNQASTLTVAGASAVGGLSINGTLPITAIVDANNFTVDAYDLNSGVNATSTATGGGASATYTGNNLVAGSPSRWSVFEEKVQFDVALDVAAAMKLLYYRRPILLSSDNTTNWLTDRYPGLLRVACLASAAKYMKDDGEYQKNFTELTAMIGGVAANDDLSYRGATFGTDTPHGR